MSNLATQLLPADIALPVAAVFQTLDLSRATYYRRQANPASSDPDMQLRDQIQRLALEWPQYGYRRITAELHRQRGVANHKRVLCLMREDNLLCLRKRRFLSTTDSNHSLLVYRNLVPELRLTSINQSDRGVQYASTAYTELLKERGIHISMSRRGNPYDNAKAERFMKTLKYEEVYLFEYETLAEARERISHFLEEVYNQKRLHSAIGYVPPAEYEQQLGQSTDA